MFSLQNMHKYSYVKRISENQWLVQGDTNTIWINDVIKVHKMALLY